MAYTLHYGAGYPIIISSGDNMAVTQVAWNFEQNHSNPYVQVKLYDGENGNAEISIHLKTNTMVIGDTELTYDHLISLIKKA